MFEGVRPDKFCDRWSVETNGVKFMVYLVNSTGDWGNLKIVLATGKAKKANFRVAWNFSEGRFAKNKDIDLLVESFPEMKGLIKKVIGFDD